MLKQSSSRTKKILAILLVVLLVASLIPITASARGGGAGISGGYNVDGGIYDNPLYFPAGNPYKNPNQPDYAGDVYT